MTVEDVLSDAMAKFWAVVSLEEAEPSPVSHRSFQLLGLDSVDAVTSLGCILTGFVAQVVTLDLQIQAVFGQPAGGGLNAWLLPAIRRLVGTDNDTNNDDNPNHDQDRNPWICEGLMHVCALRCKEVPLVALPGGILAKTEMPTQVKAGGIDFLSLHETTDGVEPALQLCIGESKATRNQGATRTRDAYEFLRDLHAGSHDFEVRQKVNTLHRYLPGELGQLLPTCLVQFRPDVVPAVAYWTGSSFSWKSARQFDGIEDAHERIRLLTYPIGDWTTYFDGVSDAMRDAIAEYT